MSEKTTCAESRACLKTPRVRRRSCMCEPPPYTEDRPCAKNLQRLRRKSRIPENALSRDQKLAHARKCSRFCRSSRRREDSRACAVGRAWAKRLPRVRRSSRRLEDFRACVCAIRLAHAQKYSNVRRSSRMPVKTRACTEVSACTKGLPRVCSSLRRHEETPARAHKLAHARKAHRGRSSSRIREVSRVCKRSRKRQMTPASS